MSAWRRPVVRRIAALAVLAAAVHILLPQLARAGTTPGTGGTFHWPWLPVIVLAGATTYAMAALSLMAAAGTALTFGRTVAAQLAAASMNRLVPAGVGAMSTNVRYLERAGCSRSRAVAAVGLDSVAGFVVHAAFLVATVALVGTSHQRFHVHGPDLPDNWPLLVLVATLLSAMGIAIGAFRLRGRSRAIRRRAADRLAALAHEPRRTGRLLAASAGVTAAYALALCASVEAAGGGIPVLSVAAVYVGGSALAAAAPTPGGLGAVEAGLIAGLTAAGQPAGGAVTAVLAFRLVTYWLPVLPGAVALWMLRRAGRL
jgi:undecaprenyl-diphosphatase